MHSDGAHLPNREILHRRIHTLVAAGLLSQDIAERLKAHNQADHRSRTGKWWFCFFTPKLAGEHGIGRFFRH